MITNKLPIQNSYWIIPGRFRAGEHPATGSVDATKCKLRWLMEAGITHIIDLTEPGDADVDYPIYIEKEASAFNLKVTYKGFPIQDWSTPSSEYIRGILDHIDHSISGGKNIYLHCFGGKGRTGLVVGCYMVRHGMTGVEALKTIQELRKNIQEIDKKSPETDKQRKTVLEWTKGQ